MHYIQFKILHCISNVLSKVKRRMHAHFSERLVNYCQIAQSLAKNQSAPRYTNIKVVYVLGEILHFTSGKHKIAKKSSTQNSCSMKKIATFRLKSCLWFRLIYFAEKFYWYALLLTHDTLLSRKFNRFFHSSFSSIICLLSQILSMFRILSGYPFFELMRGVAEFVAYTWLAKRS